MSEHPIDKVIQSAKSRELESAQYELEKALSAFRSLMAEAATIESAELCLKSNDVKGAAVNMTATLESIKSWASAALQRTATANAHCRAHDTIRKIHADLLDAEWD